MLSRQSMPNDTHSPHPNHGPLRRMISSVFALLHTRLELIGVELAEERERIVSVIFLGLVAVTFAMLALISLTALIAVAFWDSYRWQVLAGITAVYALGAVICALRARAGLHAAPIVFEATLREFEKDREMFREP